MAGEVATLLRAIRKDLLDKAVDHFGSGVLLGLKSREEPPLAHAIFNLLHPGPCVALTCERSGQGRESAFADLNVRDGCPVSAVLGAVACHFVVLRYQKQSASRIGLRGVR